MNLLTLLHNLIEPKRLHFGGGSKAAATGTPPPAPKTNTTAARNSAEAFTPKKGRASTILSPRFNTAADSGKKTILGTQF